MAFTPLTQTVNPIFGNSNEKDPCHLNTETGFRYLNSLPKTLCGIHFRADFHRCEFVLGIDFGWHLRQSLGAKLVGNFRIYKWKFPKWHKFSLHFRDINLIAFKSHFKIIKVYILSKVNILSTRAEYQR